MSGVPSMFKAGAVHDTVAEPKTIGAMVRLNGASDVVAIPSLTLMTMFEYKPSAVGVPDSVPDVVEKLAHEGLFCTLKVNASPSASLPFGVNEYPRPTDPATAGMPEITGAALGG